MRLYLAEESDTTPAEVRVEAQVVDDLGERVACLCPLPQEPLGDPVAVGLIRDEEAGEVRSCGWREPCLRLTGGREPRGTERPEQAEARSGPAMMDVSSRRGDVHEGDR